MYYPYFRGKQFELLAIRESAAVLAQAHFCPIIEPVRETLNGLHRTLKQICDSAGNAIVIINPTHGDHANDGDGISDFLQEEFKDSKCISAGILLRDSMTVNEALTCFNRHASHQPVFLHAGFTEARHLAAALANHLPDTKHIFSERHCNKLYRKHFEGSTRILLRDGFRKRKNADHPPAEDFSDLHITYPDEGMDGFGDFLIVGEEFSEGGGPAYAVAIHLTFIDPDRDEAMFIYHFVSDDRDTPTDPGGKFAQALKGLIAKCETGNSKLFDSTGLQEFKLLHENGHFPGLGVVKKLSMKHHIETLANHLK